MVAKTCRLEKNQSEQWMEIGCPELLTKLGYL